MKARRFDLSRWIYSARLRELGVVLACTSALEGFAPALERLEPASGCLIGMLLGDNDTVPALSARLGLTPAAYTRFFAVPLTASARQDASTFLQEVRSSGGIAVLALEPFGGLETITPVVCDDLVNLCAEAEAQGIDGIMIRFAHEMNGHWYPWAQKPALYRQTFQLLATKIHAGTSRTATLWSPNNGVGYPFGNGAYSAAPGSPDFIELDTNLDGSLSQADDMFGPFYPGDSAVDWVGLTIYHWGLNYPWLENEAPFSGEFANTMNAAGPGSPANYSRWFYARYCADGVHDKPLIIAETAAFYNTEQPGANELLMKRAWFRQIYNISGVSADGPDVAVTFPKMKCVNWFDHYKRESEAQNQFIDWRASSNPLVRSAFVQAVSRLRNGQPYFLTAQEFALTQSANGITAGQLPAILPLSGDISVTLNAKASSACDLGIDLLDQNFVFRGGTRVAVAAGQSTVSATFPLNSTLIDGAHYRWSIFLTPTGGTYQNALARYNGPDPVARTVTPAVTIDAYPPAVQPGTVFNVRVKYTAAQNSELKLTLLNASQEPRGTASLEVMRGDGLVDLTLTPQPGNAAGAYSLTAALFDSTMNPALLVVQTAALPIQIANAPLADAAILAVEPPLVPAGEVLRFSVGYAASTARDLRLELSNANASVVAAAVQPVSAGSGSADLTISYPLATPGTYTARVHIVPPGGSTAQAVAQSSVQSLRVVSDGYWQWTLGEWGVILHADPIHPLLDPDGDGAVNQDEYLALTDPRDRSSRFKASVFPFGSQLKISCPSVFGRSYQLFARPNLQTGAWSPASNVQPGTGGTMEFQIDPSTSGGQQFFRVQVALP